MTNQFDELEHVLAELRQRHRQLEAPSNLAKVLCAATYASRSRRRRRIGWRVGAIAAAILVAAVAWRAGRVGSVIDRRPLPAEILTANETMTEFVALPGSAGLPPPIETSVLQVRLRKGELRRYGFDIPPSSDGEFVRADFVIGDDGLARAVRFPQ